MVLESELKQSYLATVHSTPGAALTFALAFAFAGMPG